MVIVSISMHPHLTVSRFPECVLDSLSMCSYRCTCAYELISQAIQHATVEKWPFWNSRMVIVSTAMHSSSVFQRFKKNNRSRCGCD